MPIKILGQDFNIVDEPEGSLEKKYVGTVCYKKSEIALERDLLPDVRNSTILHEIIHALDYKLKLDLSEDQVIRLETGLFAVMKDNNIPLIFPKS